MRRKRWIPVLVVAVVLGMFSSGARAQEEAKGWEVRFHGFVESNMTLRDQNGIQNGFMDHLDVIQQRNTLKFDVDIDPKLSWDSFSVAKIHLTYRGAYDSIFDLRKGAYGDIDNKGGPSRFDYGKRDIKYENDLREASVDLTYQGVLGTAFFRPGRQLVSWGETTGMVLLDVICPLDQSFNMFFQNPDDLMIPLWMGRLNYSIPRQPAFGLNFDLIFIPDIRPTQFGPLDATMAAPYVTITPFAGLAPFAQLNGVRQDVPTDRREYGIKVGAEIGERLSISLVYFRDVVNDPAINLDKFMNIPVAGFIPTRALLTHGMQHVYGGYFSYQFVPLDIIIRGEFSRYTSYPVTLPSGAPDVVIGAGGLELRTYRLKPVTQWMVAIDKNVWLRFLFPHQQTNLGVQWIHQKTNSWDGILSGSPLVGKGIAKDKDFFSFQLNSYWWSGRLNPVLFLLYSPEGDGKGGGTWMVQPSMTWTLSPHWYTKLTAQVFLGDKDSKSALSTFGFPELIKTSEVTLKVGYQW